MELAIVGGGPAGLATALHLLRHDSSWAERMAVLEKAAHPRHKLCAGGITQFGLRQLEQLGLTPEVQFVPIEQAHFHYGRQRFTVRGKPLFIVTRRQEFDAWLAGEARRRGVPLLENHAVREIVRTERGFRLETATGSIQARAIVGADGARGPVRRWLAADRGKERGAHRANSRVARLLEVVHRATGKEPHYRQRAALFDFSSFQRDLQGYYWDFPSLIGGAPYINSGIYDSRVDPQGGRADLPGLLAAGLGRDPDHLEGHPIHWFDPTNLLSAPGVLLVGDAAGAEPLLGEGIAIALGYGRVAAQTIEQAFRHGTYGFHDYRRRLLLSPVGRYLMVRWLGAQLLYHIRRQELAVRALWWVMRYVVVLLSPSRAWPPLRGAT